MGKITQAAKKALRKVLPETLIKKIEIARLRVGKKFFEPKIVEHKYGSNIFKVKIADPLANSWYNKDWPEQTEFAELRKYSLKPGAKIFNIGAHQGVVAMMLAKDAGENGKVIALEANPYNAKIAEENKNLNGIKQLSVLSEAIGDKPGELLFNDDLNGQVSDKGKIKVQARTIDSLTQEYGAPDLITLDIEGFECAALKGAFETITKYRPDFYVEVHVKAGLEELGGSVRKLISYFPQNIYRFVATEPESGVFQEIDFSKEEAFEKDLVKNRFYLLVIKKV